jgi:hypothetical protein
MLAINSEKLQIPHPLMQDRKIQAAAHPRLQTSIGNIPFLKKHLRVIRDEVGARKRQTTTNGTESRWKDGP